MGKNSIGDNNENIFQNITNSQINIIENNDNLMILINSIDKFYTLVKPELINEANQILNNNFQKFKKTINNKPITKYKIFFTIIPLLIKISRI